MSDRPMHHDGGYLDFPTEPWEEEFQNYSLGFLRDRLSDMRHLGIRQAHVTIITDYGRLSIVHRLDPGRDALRGVPSVHVKFGVNITGKCELDLVDLSDPLLLVVRYRVPSSLCSLAVGSGYPFASFYIDYARCDHADMAVCNWDRSAPKISLGARDLRRLLDTKYEVLVSVCRGHRRTGKTSRGKPRKGVVYEHVKAHTFTKLLSLPCTDTQHGYAGVLSFVTTVGDVSEDNFCLHDWKGQNFREDYESLATFHREVAAVRAMTGDSSGRPDMRAMIERRTCAIFRVELPFPDEGEAA